MRPSTDALGPSGAHQSSPTALVTTVSERHIGKITETLRKIGASRPTKLAALRRVIKSLLGATTDDASIEVALRQLIASGIVTIGNGNDVKYPMFESSPGAAHSV